MQAVKVLAKGQITLPKKIRQHLHINVGDALIIEEEKDRIVIKKRKTIYDFAGTLPDLGMSIEEMIEKATEEAMRERAKSG
ncbi:MAG: AbrB/MazE/SpoVT family DNA-binding domain-containing protein [Nitrospirae bacterium]|nr:AbrB/MazE/SpoVT family DNA-binding domain-containing protein [Nitrospirota bacterium]